MAVNYHYDLDKNIIHTQMLGKFTSGEVLNFLEEVLTEDLFPGFIEVVDLSAVEDFVFSYSDSLKIIVLNHQWVQKGHGISILYAPNQMAEDIAKLLTQLSLHANIELHVLSLAGAG